VVATGRATEFGKISERLKLRAPETEFQRGVRRFGNLLLEITLMLVISIFAINVYLHRPVLESFPFSLALAVGLTPQLLPVIISINLAHGAKLMARKRVIVKHLPAIENFGNMFSMAGASLFLPFLPLLPKQILLTNLLTDVPEMTIAADHVDPETVKKPRRWDIRFIRRFMLTFGVLSSAFDYATFAVLLLLLHASTEQFRAGWFIESVVSATLIVPVIRTPKICLKGRPHMSLVIATLIIAAVIPYSPLARIFSFQKVPPVFLLAVGCIISTYVVAVELVKKLFYKTVQVKALD